MKVTAELNNLRISPRKVKLVADLIKGMDAIEAVAQLDVAIKKTSGYMQKLLLSAIANGENNFGLSKSNLYVLDAVVGAGPTLKRWMPKAYGRAGQILKRTSKVRIVLEERVEGKDRKSKDQMEKEKAEKVKKATQELRKEEERKKEEKKDEVKDAKTEKIAEVKTKSADKTKKTAEEPKSWKNKIFRRKSM
jgi:large subunit ribosomal protein L22